MTATMKPVSTNAPTTWSQRVRARQGAVAGLVVGALAALVAWTVAHVAFEIGNWGTDRVTALTSIAWILGFNLGVGTWNPPIGWLLGWTTDPELEATEAGASGGRSRYLRFCTDHKVVGMQYLVLGLTLLAVGGVGALLIRTQLLSPHSTFLGPTAYGDVVTLHGLSMVIGALLLLIGPFASFVVPLMIGARSVALPRLNAMGVWIMTSAAVCLIATVVIGGADVGWTTFAPLADQASPAMTALAIAMVGLVTCVILSGISTVTTVVTMRAKGMTMQRLPIMAWGSLVAAGLAVATMAGLLLAMTFVLTDRTMGTSFFVPPWGLGGLYEIIYWTMGQPLLYVLLIPPAAALLEVASSFARRPVVNPRAIVASFIAIAAISFVTLGHHLYTAGLSPAAAGASLALTELFALPVGVVVLCLLATVWRGSIWARLPLFFVYLFLWDLVIGGVSGAVLGNPTTDRSFHGGMVVTAHFHFMMVGAVLVGAAGGLVYWFPKFTGRMLDERSGRGAFWLIAFGIQLTFLAQFWAGAEGMARRVAWYEPGFQTANQVSTAGAYLLTLGWVVLVWAGVWSARHGRPAPADPWRARTLEWLTPTPVPLRNFPVPPVVAEDSEASNPALIVSSPVAAVPDGGLLDAGAGTPSVGGKTGEG